MKKRWTAILLLPSLLMITLFLLIPVLRIVLPTIFTKEGASLKNYAEFFSDSYFVGVYFRTIRVALLTSFLCIIMALPVSFLISRIRPSKRGVLIAMATFPLLTNSVVRAFAWINILGTEGLLNQLIQALRLSDKPVKMLYTEGAVIVGQVYLFLPTMITSLIGVMENIHDETLEAANSLGANQTVSFLRIVIPLSMPGVVVGGVLVFAGAASTYSTPLMLGGNKNMMMSTMIYQQAMLLDNWTRASVIATVMIITSYFLVGCFNHLADRLDKSGD